MTIIPTSREELVTPDGKPIAKPEYNIRIPNIRIVGPRLLVLPPTRRDRTTDAGVIIPAQAQEDVQKALVILTGDGVVLQNGERLKHCVEPGDEIIYARYAGVELELDGQQYLIIQESDVRAVLTYRGKLFVMNDDDKDNDKHDAAPLEG